MGCTDCAFFGHPEGGRVKRSAILVRRAELLALVRSPAPLGYDAMPKNREQRRRLVKALRAQQRKKDRE